MSVNSALRTAWNKLPYSVRDTALLRYAKSKLRQQATENKYYSGRMDFTNPIETIEILDQALNYASHLEKTDQNAFFEFVRSLKLKTPNNKFDSNPRSKLYKEQQDKLYHWLRGSDYTAHNEALRIYVNETIRYPYPYSTKSSKIVGSHLQSVGAIIKELNLMYGSKVLEMGSGHGSLTLPLVQLGYGVTSIDISKDFIKVISGRLRQIKGRANLICADFLELNKINEIFDAIIFNASFHHCADHENLIQLLSNTLAPHGTVYFFNEPISNEFPVPWGLRMDGESIYHIRLHGWLELGFQESYLQELWDEKGFTFTKVETIDPCLGSFYKASRTLARA